MIRIYERGNWKTWPSPVLPCPFCGEANDLQILNDGVYSPTLTCNNCSASVQGDTPQQVVEYWSRRIQPVIAPDLLTAARQAHGALVDLIVFGNAAINPDDEENGKAAISMLGVAIKQAQEIRERLEVALRRPINAHL